MLKTNFRKISEVIEKEKEFEKLRSTARIYQVVDDFYRIFPDLKLLASPLKVEKDILFLHAENSVWKSELNFHKAVIIEKINNYYKEEIIKQIKFL